MSTRARHLSFPCAALLLCSALLSVGCSRSSESSSPAQVSESTLALLPEDFEGEWQGLLPCVDCQGIDVQLRLSRDADGAQFALEERYLGDAASVDYRSEGTWSEEACTLGDEAGACITLEEPGLRWFRREDGSLEAVSAEGLSLDPSGARLQRR